MRAWIVGCLCAWCGVALADANDGWQGYINDKSPDGSRYGYLARVSTTHDSKLRLLCHSNGVFSLLIDAHLVLKERVEPDENATEEAAADTFEGDPTKIKISVDQLAAVDVQITPVQGIYAIGQQHPFFWQLIAQLSAGAALRIDSGHGMHQYDLSEFTQTYHSHCGWAPGARQYRQHLHLYR